MFFTCSFAAFISPDIDLLASIKNSILISLLIEVLNLVHFSSYLILYLKLAKLKDSTQLSPISTVLLEN